MSKVTINSEDRFLTLKELNFRFKDLDIKIKDIKGKAYTVDWLEHLALEIEDSTINTFIRTFDISLGLEAKGFKEIDKPVKVAINAGILKVGNAGNIIGDIRFYSKVLNETNWDETLTPFGYSKWKQLITGDYIYQKALCKYCMQASLNADRPNVRRYLHKVDVPDVNDAGIIKLTTENQPYKVEFKADRKFHIVPDLNVTIKSYEGVESTPIVIPYNVTTKSFMVTMKVNGKFVAGSISYAARGY